MDYDFQPGWIAPRPQYFDLEGLPCDGYGYTVIISGPVRKRSRLRRRRSIREGEVPVVQRPAPARENTGSRMSRRASEQEKHVRLDISTVKEVDVRTSWNWPRISQDKFQPFGTQSSTSENMELTGKSGKSWYSDV